MKSTKQEVIKGKNYRRKESFMKNFKKIFSMVMAIAIIVAGIVITPIRAEAATEVSKLPITCYTLNGKVTTYSSPSLSNITGYIASGDLCKILAVYSNGTVKVNYPVKNGTKTAYASTSQFFKNTTFSTATKKLGQKKKVYIRATGNFTIGTVYASDYVIIIGNNGSRTQIIYPVSGGYKAGWVSGVYSLSSNQNNNSNTQNKQTCLSDAELKELTFDYVFYSDKYPDLKAAFGYNEAKLYNHFIQNGIKEGRCASPIFDVKYYLNVNTDLQKVYGSKNYTGAYTHFKYYGHNELRIFSEYYNATAYKNCYADLKNLSNKERLLHYKRYGINERRVANLQGKIPNISKDVTPSNNSYSLVSPVPSGCKFSKKTNDNGWYGYHDINRNVSTSTPVYAIADGTVTYKQAYTVVNGVRYLTSYGNFIEFTSSDKVYTAKYCHLNSFVGAQQSISSLQTKKMSGSSGKLVLGTRTVKKGEIIGYIGNTGNSSGIHLHLELRKNGKRIDPTTVFSNLR